jgi:hypothetical protein
MSIARDLVVIKGDSSDVSFSVLDSSGNPFDLNGWVVKFSSGSVSKSSYDPTQVEITDTLNGKGILHLLKSDTLTFISSQKFSLWVENGGDPINKKYTIVCGRVKFKCPNY